MKRRAFLRGSGIALAAAASGGRGSAEPARDAASLLSLLEDTPRARVIPELARLVRAGLAYEPLLQALALAAVRNVQPYPDVGFKYHAVMVLQSVHLTRQGLSPEDRWLPAIWAASYFKYTQGVEQRQTGWRMPPRRAAARADPERALRALAAALTSWDRDAADAAIVDCAPHADPAALFEVLFSFGARDLRAIGHKAITVQNAHRLHGLLGVEQTVPLLRSTVAALQNPDGDANPATGAHAADRPWLLNQERIAEIPAAWRGGRADTGARGALLQALRQASEDRAGALVVEQLRSGVAPGSIWEALFAAAAELVLLRPGIVPVHAVTTANALHHAYRAASEDRTRQLALLQCAAFVCHFGRLVGDARAELRIDALEPLALQGAPGADLDEIFSGWPDRRLDAARRTLAHLMAGGDTQAYLARARHDLAHNVTESHDYKFAEAAFENAAHCGDPAWGARLLAAAVSWLPGPVPVRPDPAVAEAVALLRG
jgi:hypothetical protein